MNKWIGPLYNLTVLIKVIFLPKIRDINGKILHEGDFVTIDSNNNFPAIYPANMYIITKIEWATNKNDDSMIRFVQASNKKATAGMTVGLADSKIKKLTEE